jgi:hypothetical protein
VNPEERTVQYLITYRTTGDPRKTLTSLRNRIRLILGERASVELVEATANGEVH